MAFDAWTELSPERRLMLETLVSHDGISEHSARLSFRAGDISWGLKRKFLNWRPWRSQRELFVTPAGTVLIAEQPAPALHQYPLHEAAPDMLAALHAAVNWFTPPNDVGPFPIEQIAAAIAKAEKDAQP